MAQNNQGFNGSNSFVLQILCMWQAGSCMLESCTTWCQEIIAINTQVQGRSPRTRIVDCHNFKAAGTVLGYAFQTSMMSEKDSYSEDD